MWTIPRPKTLRAKTFAAILVVLLLALSLGASQLRMCWLAMSASEKNPYGERVNAMSELVLWRSGYRPTCVLRRSAQTLRENDVALRGAAGSILHQEIRRWPVFAPDIVDYLGEGADDHLTSLTKALFLEIGRPAEGFLAWEAEQERLKEPGDRRKIRVIQGLIAEITGSRE